MADDPSKRDFRDRFLVAADQEHEALFRQGGRDQCGTGPLAYRTIRRRSRDADASGEAARIMNRHAGPNAFTGLDGFPMRWTDPDLVTHAVEGATVPWKECCSGRAVGRAMCRLRRPNSASSTSPVRTAPKS